MKKITTMQASVGAGGSLTSGNGDREIEAVVIDSRQAGAGSLFVAIKGENQDGHIYAQAAARQGCRAFVLSRKDTIARLAEEYPDADIIRVEDTVVGLQELSKWYLAQFQLIKIAVTGSTGKTSTKEMTAAILSQKYKTVKNEGNLNNELGLPLTAFQVDETTEAAVFEMGMSSLGEIRRLADIVRPDAAIITNVGTSHIAFLKTRENIQRAKLEVTEFFRKDNVLVVNSDSEYLTPQGIASFVSLRQKEDAAYEGTFRLISAGTGEDRDIRLLDVRDQGERGIAFALSYGGRMQEFVLPLPGRHNAHNAMLAVGVSLQFGVSLSEASKALNSMEATSRRLVIEAAGDYKLIDDSYNSSPDSIAAAVDVLKHVEGGRKVAILADVLELGEQSETLHRQSGRDVASAGVDCLIACGTQAKFMAEAAVEWLLSQGETEERVAEKVMHFACRKQLQEQLFQLLSPGDVILVKGSNGMEMALVAEQIRSAKGNQQ